MPTKKSSLPALEKFLGYSLQQNNWETTGRWKLLDRFNGCRKISSERRRKQSKILGDRTGLENAFNSSTETFAKLTGKTARGKMRKAFLCDPNGTLSKRGNFIRESASQGNLEYGNNLTWLGRKAKLISIKLRNKIFKS